MTGFSVRPSQFILTYGVGSIVETSTGPRVIPAFSEWGEIFFSGSQKNVSDYAIDVNIHPNILDGNIFRIPTNVSMQKTESQGIFKTFAFPSWGLCVEHGHLFEYENERTRCPQCRASHIDVKRTHAVRFVRACPNGHLDDVDWRHMISHKNDCTSRTYRWISVGGALDNVTIKCSCSREVTLQDVYQMNRRCTGRFPEIPGHIEECKAISQITLRGSSMLRIPILLPIVAIPGPDSILHRILQKNTILSVLISEKNWTKQKLAEKIKNIHEFSPMKITKDDIDVILKPEEAMLLSAISDVLKSQKQSPKTIAERRQFEFRTLKNAARNGHPANNSVDEHFSVSKRRIRSDANSNAVMLGNKKIRIVPIEKLRVITIQKGYQRLGTANSDNHGIHHRHVERFHVHNDERWYPAMEQIGEGIFIDDHDNDLAIASSEWSQQFNKNIGQYECHPVFAWWHSLSHRIISAISLNSGYSSTSIREVIYLDRDESGKIFGGMLLYTSQPGGDGSLGGLISKVPKFEKVVEQAITDLDFCSNDPLCSEQSVSRTGDSGASCYACLYMSETSCAYFNRFLDRKILLENM